MVNIPMENKLVLTGCGILKKEIEYLIKKNNWPVETHFLCSSLHVDFDKLYNSLEKSLKKYADRETLVFYGTCHPLIDKVIDNEHTIRTQGQNCIEILLGQKIFTDELAAGAFFLLEDWAKRWDYVSGKAFGNEEIAAAILQEERDYFLALRTPCSGDFTKEAEHVSTLNSLPLRWMDVSLDNLERVLKETLARKVDQL